MVLELYRINVSPPANLVSVVADVLNVELKNVDVNLMEGEHMTPEFRKMNPAHTVPVLKDDDIIIPNSQAIICYLTNKYAPNSSLYPTDPGLRAQVDSKLYFYEGVFWERFRNIAHPLFFQKTTGVETEKRQRLEEAVQWLEEMLDGRKYLVGNGLTLADISLASGVYSVNGMIGGGLLEGRFPNVNAWIDVVKSEVKTFDKTLTEGFELFKTIVPKYHEFLKMGFAK